MKGILIFGDSIAQGRGESPNIGWAGHLQKEFEPKGFHNCVYKLGIPGATSTSLLKRFETEVKSRINYSRPEDKFIVMIAVGINDSRGLGSPDKPETKQSVFKKNIRKLVTIAKKYTKHVIVVGLTPVDEKRTKPFEDTHFLNDTVKTYDTILEEVTKETKTKYIRLFDKLVPKHLVDGVHPNKKGYEVMFENIKKDV
ncbi:MAG: SGNH/GDSL hydrolase family protein [Candidatus Nanoarchaeia archaeon]